MRQQITLSISISAKKNNLKFIPTIKCVELKVKTLAKEQICRGLRTRNRSQHAAYTACN